MFPNINKLSLVWAKESKGPDCFMEQNQTRVCLEHWLTLIENIFINMTTWMFSYLLLLLYVSKPMEDRLVETHSVPGRKRNSKRDASIVNKSLLINKFHHINNGLSVGVSTSGKKRSHILIQYILYQKPALSILPFSTTCVRLNRLKSSELFPSGTEMMNLCSSKKSLVLL